MRSSVEGEIEVVDGVLRVTLIRVHYRVKVPRDKVDAALRALENHHNKCPVYQTISGCVGFEIDWEIQETEPIGELDLEEARAR